MDGWALRTVLSGVWMLSLRTGLGRSACSRVANILVEAHWCHHVGSSLLPTASPGTISSNMYNECSLWLTPSSHTRAFSSLSPLGPHSSTKELSRWRVVSGRTYMSTLGGSYVDRIVVNGDYDPGRNDYDVALMRLSSPINVGG